MEQVKTFEHNDHVELDSLVNGFLGEISSKGYNLLKYTIILYGIITKIMPSIVSQYYMIGTVTSLVNQFYIIFIFILDFRVINKNY